MHTGLPLWGWGKSTEQSIHSRGTTRSQIVIRWAGDETTQRRARAEEFESSTSLVSSSRLGTRLGDVLELAMYVLWIVCVSAIVLANGQMLPELALSRTCANFTVEECYRPDGPAVLCCLV